MTSMLKGHDLNSIHNLTSPQKHAALIISDDWSEKTSSLDFLNTISSISLWLVLSGFLVLTVYDQSGNLKLSSEVLEKAVYQKLIQVSPNLDLAKVSEHLKINCEAGSSVLKSPNLQIDPYTLKLKQAVNAPLNGMPTKNRISHLQNYAIDPEIAIVLDPNNKKSIFGFNFWNLRLTEFYFLNSLQPSVYEFSQVLSRYLKVEKRLGK